MELSQEENSKLYSKYKECCSFYGMELLLFILYLLYKN